MSREREHAATSIEITHGRAGERATDLALDEEYGGDADGYEEHDGHDHGHLEKACNGGGGAISSSWQL